MSEDIKGEGEKPAVSTEEGLPQSRLNSGAFDSLKKITEGKVEKPLDIEGREELKIDDIKARIEGLEKGSLGDRETINNEIAGVKAKLKNMLENPDGLFDQCEEIYSKLNASLIKSFKDSSEKFISELKAEKNRIDTYLRNGDSFDNSELVELKTKIIAMIAHLNKTRMDLFQAERDIINYLKKKDVSPLSEIASEEEQKNEKVINYFENIQTEEDLYDVLKSRDDWENSTGKHQEIEKLIKRVRALIKNGKGSVPTVLGLRDAALRIYNNTNSTVSSAEEVVGDRGDDEFTEITEADLIDDEAETDKRDQTNKATISEDEKVAEITEADLIKEEESIAEITEADLIDDVENISKPIPGEEEIVAEINNLPPEEKKSLLEQISNIGYLSTAVKSNGLKKIFGTFANLSKGNKTLNKYFNKFSGIYDNMEKKANDSRKKVGKGFIAKTSGVGQGVGNLLKYGRVIYDAYGGVMPNGLNPFRSVTALSMFAGRAFEAGKETRLDNENIIDKTRIADYKEAYNMSYDMYLSLPKDEKGRVARDDIDTAYMNTVPEDLKQRLDKLANKEHSGIKLMKFIIEKDASLFINNLNKKLEEIDSLYKNPDENKREKERLVKKADNILRDLDRMVSREGELDTLSYLSRLAEKSGKSFANLLMIDTGYRLFRAGIEAFENFSSEHFEEVVKDKYEHFFGNKEQAANINRPQTPNQAGKMFPIGERPVYSESGESKGPQGAPIIDTESGQNETNAGTNAMAENPIDNVSAEKINPELQKSLELATVHKGEGIEHALIRQLKENPEEFGFKGDLHDIEKIKGWSSAEAHKIAIKTGYVDNATGQEVRIASSGEDNVAYLLSRDNDGNPYIEELKKEGDKFIATEGHNTNSSFEGQKEESLENYEYKHQPIQVNSQTIPEKNQDLEVSGQAEQPEHHEKIAVPTDGVAEKIEVKTNEIYNKGSFWKDQTKEWQYNRNLKAQDVLENKFIYPEEASKGQFLSDFNDENRLSDNFVQDKPGTYLGNQLDQVELNNRKELIGYLEEAKKSIGDPRPNETVENYLQRYEGGGSIDGGKVQSGVDISETAPGTTGDSEKIENSFSQDSMQRFNEAYVGVNEGSRSAMLEVRSILENRDILGKNGGEDFSLIKKMFAGNMPENINPEKIMAHYDKGQGFMEINFDGEKFRNISIYDNGHIVSVRQDESYPQVWKPEGENKNVSDENIKSAFKFLFKENSSSNISSPDKDATL